MAEESSEYSGATGDGIGRFGEMSMDAQIAEASGISGIVECVTELPEPSKTIFGLGKTYQLISVQPPYVMGRFYKCVNKDGYVMWDVSEKETESFEPTEDDSFKLNGNALTLHWAYDDTTSAILIKTEIQLVHHDATGKVKSIKTIFTTSPKPESDEDTESDEDSDPNGATVIVDGYTADGIAQGKITLRTLSTYVGKMRVCDLPKKS